MAIVSVGGWAASQQPGEGVDFIDLELQGLDWGRFGVTRTTTLYALDARADADIFALSGMHQFHGTSLTYDAAGRLTGGVVTGWDVLMGREATNYLSISGLSIPAATVADWIANAIYIAPSLLAGGDSISGGAGGDSLWGFNGDDTIAGGSGDDVIAGGVPAGALASSDKADHTYGYGFSAADGANDLRGEGGDDTLSGGGGPDSINGNRGNDVIYGGPGDDVLHGGQDKDQLNGNAGADTMSGDMGDDTLRGGQGADSLSGGGGDDWLYGDRGDDTMSGGSGADVFETWSGAGEDRVLNFNPAEGDRIKLDEDDFIVRQVGGDTLIDMGGARMLLVGVSAQHWEDWVFQ